MKKRRLGRFTGAILFVALLALAFSSPPMRALESLPDALYLRSGDSAQISFALPGSIEIEGDTAAVISSFDQSAASVGATCTLTAAEQTPAKSR